MFMTAECYLVTEVNWFISTLNIQQDTVRDFISFF